MRDREIKFRAWNTDKKTMHVVTTLYAPHGVCNTMELDGEGAYGDLFPLMQYTGIDDKNGKEIYEGDIVKRFGSAKPTRRRYGEGEGEGHWVEKKVVKFLSGEKRNGWNTCKGMYEIIGNIYENPELLTPKSQ